MNSKITSAFKTIDDLDVAGKRVLVRVDFNVPMKDGNVTDSTRIERTVPTLQELSAKGARVIVISHFGRPKGQIVPEMSLRPIAEALSEALGGQPVQFANDCIGESAETVIAALSDGEFAMLENLRFHSGEEKNDAAFAGQLAALGDCYVSDAFSTSHRAHASTEGIAKLMPSAAGRLMQTEVEALAGALEAPEHPVVRKFQLSSTCLVIYRRRLMFLSLAARWRIRFCMPKVSMLVKVYAKPIWRSQHNRSWHKQKHRDVKSLFRVMLSLPQSLKKAWQRKRLTFMQCLRT